jgi:hypothetical protein
MSTKAISLKLSVELLDRLKAKAEADGTTVTALLIEGVSGSTKPDPRVAELEAALATMTKDRDRWRQMAHEPMPEMITGVPMPTSNAEARRLATQHPSGPVYEPRLSVSGTAKPFFRPGTTADKATKSGG